MNYERSYDIKTVVMMAAENVKYTENNYFKL